LVENGKLVCKKRRKSLAICQGTDGKGARLTSEKDDGFGPREAVENAAESILRRFDGRRLLNEGGRGRAKRQRGVDNARVSPATLGGLSQSISEPANELVVLSDTGSGVLVGHYLALAILGNDGGKPRNVLLDLGERVETGGETGKSRTHKQRSSEGKRRKELLLTEYGPR
jgi:hypothetical protein